MPKDISEIIKLFEEVDVKNKRYYANKTQRKACEFLLEEHGIDKIEKVLQFYLLAKKQDHKYLPIITSPYELVEKWSKLEGFIKRELFNGQSNVVW